MARTLGWSCPLHPQKRTTYCGDTNRPPSPRTNRILPLSRLVGDTASDALQTLFLVLQVTVIAMSSDLIFQFRDNLSERNCVGLAGEHRLYRRPGWHQLASWSQPPNYIGEGILKRS